MREDHITQQLLESVRRGEVSGGAFVQRLARHLWTVCPECRLELEEAAGRRPLAPAELAVRPLLEVLERWRQRFGKLEKAAPRELAELLALVPEQRLERVRRAVKRFRNPLLAERLLDEARDTVKEQPQRARELAELALEVSLHLSVGQFGLELPQELALRAQAHRANALRVAGELAEAERGLAVPLRKIPEIPDPLSQAEVFSLAASLRRDQRRFREALELLGRAGAVYREVGQRRLLARTLLKSAQVCREMGAVEKALAAAEAAGAGFEEHGDSQLYLCAQHEIACALADAGRYGEAREVMRTHEALYERFSDRWTQLRRGWVEGRVAHGLGELEAAEAAFEEVRMGYLEQGLPYDAAVASLDLALLHTEQGRFEEVRRLAEEMILVFQAQEVHREAFAALLLFRDAARAEAVTVEMVRRLAAYLERARHDPTLSYQPQS